MTTTAALERRSSADIAAHLRGTHVVAPLTDIRESTDAIVIVADMPGVGESGIECSLEQDVLTLVGRRATAARGGYQLAYGDAADHEFRRSFALGADIDRERIEATIKDGLLTVTLPKAPQAKPRKIAVRGD